MTKRCRLRYYVKDAGSYRPNRYVSYTEAKKIVKRWGFKIKDFNRSRKTVCAKGWKSLIFGKGGPLTQEIKIERIR